MSRKQGSSRGCCCGSWLGSGFGRLTTGLFIGRVGIGHTGHQSNAFLNIKGALAELGAFSPVEKSRRLAGVLATASDVEVGVAVVVVVAAVSATMWLLQLASTDSTSALACLGSFESLPGSLGARLLGDVFIQRLLRQTIFRLSLEKLYCTQVHLRR